SLAFGLVLGPEAPLIVLGVVAGALTARLVGATGPGAQLISIAGAFAAISIVLGGPLVSSLALFEILAVSGAVASAAIVPTLAPGFVAAGTGALAYTGIADWPGLNQAALHGPDLVDYPSVRVADIAWCLVVAVLVGVAAALARPFAQWVDRAVSARPTLALVAGGFAVGAIGVVFRAITDRPVDLVLFSGQTSLPAIAAEGSAGVLALVVVAKAVCLAISMGAGFRGGAIFPSVAIGAAAGAMCAVILPGLATTPAVVAGIAAGAAAGVRMPVFGAVLAALLVHSDISDAIPIAVVASVAGWLVALVIDRILARRDLQPAAGG
ncbi:MAG: chloride channel protein, partial [Thermoleophilia bacterium]|nr:chloride channel protein [Thermoleophilia bacterium]